MILASAFQMWHLYAKIGRGRLAVRMAATLDYCPENATVLYRTGAQPFSNASEQNT